MYATSAIGKSIGNGVIRANLIVLTNATEHIGKNFVTIINANIVHVGVF
jgi:hypothetical protein